MIGVRRVRVSRSREKHRDARGERHGLCCEVKLDDLSVLNIHMQIILKPLVDQKRNILRHIDP